MSWERLASFVSRRPRTTLLVSLAVLIAPAFALPHMRVSYDQLDELPASADSVRGFEALEGSFEPGEIQPMQVVVRSDEELFSDRTFTALDDLTVNLGKVPTVTGVRSVTRPTTGKVTPEQLEQVGLGDIATLANDLPRATDGLQRIIDGLGRMRAGLLAVLQGVPEQRDALGRGLSGIEALRDGLDRIRAGLREVLSGLDRIEAGLRDGSAGLDRLASDVADPALANLQAAWADLRQETVGKLDPQYGDLARHVGRALATISGRCPSTAGIGPQPASCPAGAPVAPGYDGLGPTLRDAADGLREAADGVSRVSVGLGRILGGFDRLDAGLGRLGAGLASGRPQLERLEAGVGRMVDGVDRIVPGLRRLRRGLALGAAMIQRAGLIPAPGDEVALTASLVEAFPKLREQLEVFMGDGGRATRIFVILDQPPYRAEALDAAREMREVAELSVRETTLEDAELVVAGTPPFFADVEDTVSGDYGTLTLAVIVGILIVLALLLRSVVAPLYLVGTVLLSFASTLGLSVIVFQGVLHDDGLTWWLPGFLFVILVALGADYNIFLIGRIREEAETKPTREAVPRGLAATGRVITSAGIILAGTFAALLVSPLGGLVQMGFATTAGLLIDTFIVRSLLVPSIAVLVGSASWWPSARARRP